MAQFLHPFHGNFSIEGRKEWPRDGGSLKKVRETLVDKRTSNAILGSLFDGFVLREVNLIEKAGGGSSEVVSVQNIVQ